MVPRRRFNLVYAAEVKRHLKGTEHKHYGLIRSKIEEQLWFEPDVETRNRKPLIGPAAHDAEWEIRFGSNNRFRAFYEIDQGAAEVHILAIGVKTGNRLVVGGEEFEA